jgi:hypothetical protein
VPVAVLPGIHTSREGANGSEGETPAFPGIYFVFKMLSKDPLQLHRNNLISSLTWRRESLHLPNP